MENKRENFIRIATNRTNKIIDTIQSLSNLTNTSYYEYTTEDIEKIFSSIIEEAENTKAVLLNANKNKKRFLLWLIIH